MTLGIRLAGNVPIQRTAHDDVDGPRDLGAYLDLYLVCCGGMTSADTT